MNLRVYSVELCSAIGQYRTAHAKIWQGPICHHHSRTGVRQSIAGISEEEQHLPGGAWLREWLPQDVYQHAGAGQDEPITPNGVEPGDGTEHPGRGDRRPGRAIAGRSVAAPAESVKGSQVHGSTISLVNSRLMASPARSASRRRTTSGMEGFNSPAMRRNRGPISSAINTA